MKLATRISLFFLTALALVLLGMSASIYCLARAQQLRRLDEQISTALDQLTAAVEFGREGLEWESGERQFTFTRILSDEPWAWGVFTSEGEQLDHFKNSAFPLADYAKPISDGDQVEHVQWGGNAWQVVRRTLRSQSTHIPDLESGPPAREPEVKRYRSLVLLVAVPMQSVIAPLRTLATSLVLLTVAIWSLAALGGRWLAGKALAPVTEMAYRVRSMSAADLGERIATAPTGDELEDLGRAFNDLLARLQISFEQQEQFTAEASHQLRTPLTAMLGQMDVALRRGRDADEYRQALESAQRQGARLQQIVDSLLFLAREDRDAAIPELEWIDLQSWLPEHVEQWNHSDAGRLQYRSNQDGALWIRAHRLLLGEAIDNLLDNACKYSEPGSPIVLETGREANHVWLAVEDRGYGIDPADLQHVFDPFFRCSEARQRGVGGTGLGLALVRKIVTAFNGQIDVQSESGRGSRFVLTWPASNPMPAKIATG